MKKTTVNIIKVGGKVVENPQALASFLDIFARVEGAKILVHGGGTSATAMAGRLGVATEMVEGRRVTSPEMLEVAMMVYGGLVNKKIVAGLQWRCINAVGLSGADFKVIEAHKRVGGKVDYGMVGDVDRVDGKTLARLIADGVTPVLAPLSYDPSTGRFLNTNADTIASSTAIAMAADPSLNVNLIFCFEKAGVLMDADDESTVIGHINPSIAQDLIQKEIVAGGMIPKITNALDAIEQGVNEVVITRYEAIDNSQAGTHITA